MPEVRVAITRYVDDHFPGYVECKLTDVEGKEWFLIEKVPVVTVVDLDSTSIYPSLGLLSVRFLTGG